MDLFFRGKNSVVFFFQVPFVRETPGYPDVRGFFEGSSQDSE